jgi:hypothetical protein
MDVGGQIMIRMFMSVSRVVGMAEASNEQGDAQTHQQGQRQLDPVV